MSEGFRERVRSAIGGELPNASAPLDRLMAPSTESRVEHVRLEVVLDRDWFAPVDREDGTYRGLRSSVRASGVLQPLLLRRHHGGWLQVVSGARRLQAARDTAQATVPAVVRELSDVQALVGSWDVVLRRGVTHAERDALETRLVQGGMSSMEAAALVSTAPELNHPAAAALLVEPLAPELLPPAPSLPPVPSPDPALEPPPPARPMPWSAPEPGATPAAEAPSPRFEAPLDTAVPVPIDDGPGGDTPPAASPWPGAQPGAPATGAPDDAADAPRRAPWSFGTIPQTHTVDVEPAPAREVDSWPAAAAAPPVPRGARGMSPPPHEYPSGPPPAAVPGAAPAADEQDGQAPEPWRPLGDGAGDGHPAVAARPFGPMIGWPAAGSPPGGEHVGPGAGAPGAPGSPEGWPSPQAWHGELAPTHPPEPLPIDPVLFPFDAGGAGGGGSERGWGEPASPGVGVAFAGDEGGGLDASGSPREVVEDRPSPGGALAGDRAESWSSAPTSPRSPSFGWPSPLPAAPAEPDAGAERGAEPGAEPFTPEPWWAMVPASQVSPPAAPTAPAPAEPGLAPPAPAAPDGAPPSAPPPLPEPTGAVTSSVPPAIEPLVEPARPVFEPQARPARPPASRPRLATVTVVDDMGRDVPVTDRRAVSARSRHRRRPGGPLLDPLTLTVLGIAVAVGALAFAGISALVGDGGTRLVVAGAVALVGFALALLNARRAIAPPGT